MNQNVMTIYPAGTTNFDYQGYGTLYDAYSAEVTEASSTNGNITETMEITYPVNGVLSDKIVEGNLVKAQISKTDGDYQIFEIDETEKSDNTVITAYLNAYPYRVLRMSFTNGGKFANFETLTRLLDYAKSYMPDLPTDFSITTNISNPINLAQVQTDPSLTPVPTVFKDFSSLLDAILNKVSGQVKFGPRSIEILAHRGQDKSNIELRDDKNTNGISVKIDTTNIVNKIIPLLPVKDKDGNSTSETVVGRIVTPKDPFRFINFYSGQVVNVDTQDLADSYFSRTNCNYPVTTATVTTSMIDEDLSDIRLFDVVSVYSSRINYTAKLKVSERVFDVLAGAVDSFKLGTSSVNVFSTQTAAMNQVEQAVAIGNQALTSANGKNTNYYGDSKPTDGKEGDTWFHTVDGVSQMDQFTGGVWKTIVSDTFGKEVDKKVATAQAEASDAKTKAEEGVAKAEATAAKFDDTNQKAEQALNNSVSAQSSAASAVAKAESTASEFGKVKQNADTALSAALNAQTSASAAVAQASSAAADSKDAKQIAGAVSQSYKTLTDGSTMTIAELQNGLAAKLTKTDLNGYATQGWTQNKIKMTADGINGTMSSIKATVDSQTTSINELKADSSSFKSQFTTVTDTIGKQTTDIGSLQVSSKELTTGFNTLTTDNTTNKNDISQLKQTSTEVSSTLETVKTQVQNSAVGTNLLTNSNFSSGLDHWTVNLGSAVVTTDSDGDTCVHITGTGSGCGLYCFPSFNQNQVTTGSVLAKGTGELLLVGLERRPGSNFGTISTKSYSKFSSTMQAATGPNAFVVYFNPINGVVDVYIKFVKLEIGSRATDWCPNPLETATVTAVSKLSQTVDGMQTDISKKIEQKDLNGYATQDWSQNQIKITADGINGTISSVKNTVNSQTTSINDLKADSSSFKGQFTTVNDTLDKQHTDISTLQADSERLSSSFDSLNTDNGTNQHNISDLQQSAREFSSTLLTVQTQVQDSAVGTNLLTGTSNTQDYTVSGSGWALGSQSSNGTNASIPCTPGASYTYSAIVQSTTYDCYPEMSFFDSGKHFILNSANFPGKDIGMRKITEVAPENAAFMVAHMVLKNPPDSQTVVFNSEKLEKGSMATDWCANPMDNATVTAVSSISQTVSDIQTTVRGKVDNSTYQSNMTQLNGQITSVVGQVNNIGQRNLVYNSELRTNTDGWESNVHLDVGTNQWDHINGSNSLVFSPHGNAVGNWSHAYSKMIPVVQGMQYSFSGTMFITGTTPPTADYISLELNFFDDSGNRVGSPGARFDISKWNEYQFLKVEGVVTPTDATKVCLAVQMNGDGNVLLNHPMMVAASTVGPYLPDNATQSQITQLKDSISLRVEKAGVINAVNVSSEGIQIYGNKLHITADTYIDNAIIKDAMISNVSADKMTTGTLNAANVNVINLNGSHIVSNSITSNQLASGSVTADKIQSGAIRVSLNNSLQRLEIGVDGMNLMSNDGAIIGRIHSNHMNYDSSFWGLTFDMSANGGDFMAWGAQNNGDVNGDYQTKLAWYRWATHGYDGGFHFQDRVEFHNSVQFRNSIDTRANYLLSFGSTNVSGYSSVPYLGLSGGATKISFSPGSVWLSRHNNYYNMGAVIEGFSHYLGKAVFLPTGMHSDGRASSWTGVNIPSE